MVAMTSLSRFLRVPLGTSTPNQVGARCEELSSGGRNVWRCDLWLVKSRVRAEWIVSDWFDWNSAETPFRGRTGGRGEGFHRRHHAPRRTALAQCVLRISCKECDTSDVHVDTHDSSLVVYHFKIPGTGHRTTPPQFHTYTQNPLTHFFQTAEVRIGSWRRPSQPKTNQPTNKFTANWRRNTKRVWQFFAFSTSLLYLLFFNLFQSFHFCCVVLLLFCFGAADCFHLEACVCVCLSVVHCRIVTYTWTTYTQQ